MSLAEALRIYSEELDISEYQCGKCGNVCAAKQSSRIYKLPQVLMLNLNRATDDYYNPEKIETIIEYPL
jgi:uncharacterized UBP type Zn finger protein